ncbi:Hypothetical predicted protein [Octopus vulgaris]|uniref:Uncharacterized protein n=2 Tax=Octopus TaxID=6643 RepID=A0AA36AV56_OCTVU|nr:uncharacterized protein LOC115211918 [Octopus sinensis]CAI9722881.1 Hypothetical predicted protein [Octopus vulgaris]
MNCLLLLTLLAIIPPGIAIQCYQCDSNEDISCPSSEAFDTKVNGLIDCNSFEANVPGQFCMKRYQQSPGWNGWIKITRRCASRTSSGVAWGCQWVWDEAGVFTETCYCDQDGCNTAPSSAVINYMLLVLAVMFVIFNI